VNKLKSSNFPKFQSRGARQHFFSKTLLLNNFLTVRPIFTSNTPIHSAKQGKQNEIIQFLNFNLEEQGSYFTKKLPS
jgi:hypothetical protein